MVDNDSSKRRSGRGGSHGGAGRLACQSPRETPAWLCVHKAGLCQPCMLSGGPLCGASSLFLHLVACVAHINVYLCHIHRVRHQMSAFGGIWFTSHVQLVFATLSGCTRTVNNTPPKSGHATSRHVHTRNTRGFHVRPGGPGPYRDHMQQPHTMRRGRKGAHNGHAHVPRS